MAAGLRKQEEGFRSTPPIRWLSIEAKEDQFCDRPRLVVTTPPTLNVNSRQDDPWALRTPVIFVRRGIDASLQFAAVVRFSDNLQCVGRADQRVEHGLVRGRHHDWNVLHLRQHANDFQEVPIAFVRHRHIVHDHVRAVRCDASTSTIAIRIIESCAVTTP
jgi:hypothetical protein